MTILDAIGNTPMVRLRTCAPANRAEVYRALIVMADCFTAERFQLLRA